MSHSKQKKVVLLLAAAVAVIGLFLWWQAHQARSGGVDSQTGGSNPIPSVAASPGDDLFSTAQAALRNGGGADHARRTLGELKAQMEAMPREQSVAAIRAALASGRDAETGLGFKIGAGGALSEAPSLRVFLLDELARLNPAAAAELARSILATKTSADEWAVALRNLARVQNTEADRTFLQGKMRELLTHEPWQKEASAGYLEAFDVAVHLRSASLAPELSELLRRKENDQRAAAHAAFLALDRLAIADPVPLLSRLTDEPALMQGREATRAGYLARADVSDPAQRAIVERYLMDASRPAEELKSFAGVFPNGNFMISQNLLTTVATPDRATQLARDQAALRVVNEWLADARFAGIRATLEQMRTRLESFLRQSGE